MSIKVSIESAPHVRHDASCFPYCGGGCLQVHPTDTPLSPSALPDSTIEAGTISQSQVAGDTILTKEKHKSGFS